MQSPESGPVSRSWDAEYRRGRYRDEPPVPFVGSIVRTLRDQPEIMRGRGLYVGCGNGRNYVPLVNAGLNLIGLDVSKEAIAQLQAGHPHLAPDLVRADFHDFHSELPFDYIEGPKRGLTRESPKRGSWAQWEGVWVRR